MAVCSSTGVTVHAVVRSVCDPQPGRLHALLSERTDGQVDAHLPGKQLHASVVFCLMLQCPSSQMHVERARNNCGYAFSVDFTPMVFHTNPLCMGMFVDGEWTVCVLRTHSTLLHVGG